MTDRRGARVRARLFSFLAVLLFLAPTAMAGEAPADTLRTNLWWTQALMDEILSAGAEHLPDDGAPVLITAEGTHPASDLMRVTAVDLLEEAGHPVHLLDEEFLEDDEFAPVPADVPYEFRFRLENVEVAYPRTGRRLGLWRTWVDRDLEVSAVVTVRDRRNGLLLLDERLVRTYGDRLPGGDLEPFETSAYTFTAAQAEEGGVAAIFEEVLVLGALTGLVIAYFGTTSE